MVELIGLILTFLVFAIPGIFLSFALFTGTAFNKLDRLLAGLVLGMILVPLLYFLEAILFGLQLNVFFIFLNSLLLLAAGIVVLYFRKAHGIFSPRNLAAVFQREVEALEKKPLLFIVPFVLGLITLAGFFLRIGFTFITNFFEFDPYYYMSLTEMLVRKGAIPLTSDISYFPFTRFHHEPAFVQYMTGAWYSVYSFFTHAAYDKGTLILIANIYPPLVGALLSVLAFWLLRSQYNEIAGIVGALFFASTPTLLQKLAAGVAETQPWSMFSALFIFTAFALALRYKNWQFTLLAALSIFVSILGTAQALWPVAILAVFFMVQAFVNYYAGHNEKELAIISLVFSASVLLSNLLYNLYAAAQVLAFSPVVLIAIASCLPAVLFYAFTKVSHFSTYSRRSIVLAIFAIGVVFSLLPVLPGGQSVSSVASTFIDSTASFAHYLGPLSRTIAEETPTDPSVLAQVFGILNPSVILVSLSLLVALAGLEALLLKNQRKAAGVFIAAVIAAVLLHSYFDDFLIAFGTSTGLKIVATLGNLFAANDMFTYMLIAIASAIVAFIYSPEERRNEAALLGILVVYPVAYIGLNKVKFLLHLGFALVVGIGLLMGEVMQRSRFIHEYFKLGESIETPRKWLTGFVVVLLLILGSVQVFGFSGKAPGVIPSVASLAGSQISQDWLDAMGWLHNNTSYKDPVIESNCIAKFGHECRAISWWDYGHWISFLGDTKTVLDPGNQYEFLDQQAAYGFVDNQTAFRDIMLYHNASHVLVDFQLIDKWGALVFLSGTCQKTSYSDNSTNIRAPNCPDTRQIVNWQKGAGNDAYEIAHYFEHLNVNGQCPFSQNMLLLQGSFGSVYCASQEQLVPVDRSGLRTDLARSYQAVDLVSKVDNIDPNKHYLIPLTQTSFVDVNPDLRIAGRESKVLDSAYTRLYVFENLPGFRLVYRSPHGEVKIFERTFHTNGNSDAGQDAPAQASIAPEASAGIGAAIPLANSSNSSAINVTNASQNITR